MNGRSPELSPDSRLRDCPERQVALSLVGPISHRLDELVSLLRSEAGRDTTRKELVAALLLAATTDPSALDKLVRSYRLAVVADALVDADGVSDGEVLRLPQPRPGPRPA